MANNMNLALPKFSAASSDPTLAETFLDQYDNYCTVHALTDDQKVSTLYSALTGNAAVWFRNAKTANQEITWADVRQKFKDYYTAPVPRANRAEIAAKCIQKTDEDTRTFLQRCLATANQCIPVPGNGGLVARTIHVTIDGAQHNVDYLPTEADAKVWTQVYRHETAVNLFIAGCDAATRRALLLDARWTTWEELCTNAIRIQATVNPTSIARQLRTFTGPAPKPSTPTVAAITPTAPAGADGQATHGQTINPVTGGQNFRGRGKGKGRSGSSKPPPDNSNKPPPHPQQPKTHQHPVQCYYCTGQYHTERHCLAKQASNGLVGSVAPPPPPPPAAPQDPALLGAVHYGAAWPTDPSAMPHPPQHQGF